MAKGLSLHIGLNSVDPNAYDGWDGQLSACEFDAHDMRDIAKSLGYKPTVILTKDAKSDNVLSAIASAALQLEAGDSFFLTYSGHGGQVPDTNGDESDKEDETWVLYNRQLIDDELNNALATFKEGVKISVLSDSCHSGTMARKQKTLNPRKIIKVIPRKISFKNYNANKSVYESIQKELLKDVKASVILISGCQDNQTSLDGERNGLFTEKLRLVWTSGAFTGYKNFHKKILALMPPRQSPNLFTSGILLNTHLESKPFTI